VVVLGHFMGSAPLSGTSLSCITRLERHYLMLPPLSSEVEVILIRL
jgi:hypothetical protein